MTGLGLRLGHPPDLAGRVRGIGSDAVQQLHELAPAVVDEPVEPAPQPSAPNDAPSAPTLGKMKITNPLFETTGKN